MPQQQTPLPCQLSSCPKVSTIWVRLSWIGPHGVTDIVRRYCDDCLVEKKREFEETGDTIATSATAHFPLAFKLLEDEFRQRVAKQQKPESPADIKLDATPVNGGIPMDLKLEGGCMINNDDSPATGLSEEFVASIIELQGDR